MNDVVRVTRSALSTTDPELAHELLSQTYARHSPRISGSAERFRFSLRTASAGRVATDTMVHSMSTDTLCEPVHQLTAAYLASGSMVVRHGGEEEHFGPGEIVLYPYGTPFSVHWSRMDQTLLRLDFDSLARLAARQTDTDAGAFRFLGVRPISTAMGDYWRSVTTLAFRELAVDRSALVHPLVLAQTEATLASAALAVFPNTTLTEAYSAPVGQLGAAALRRALDYIDAHAGEPLTLGDIASAARVGARALRHAFTAYHDTTPMGHLRRVRLDRAHRELRAADPTRTTVGHIALRWGFTSRSRFVDTYRHTYGVDPGDTLRARPPAS